jgi:hypothetical protein
VIKRYDCPDRRIFDAKIFELNCSQRLQPHSNILHCFSYWAEKSDSEYSYRAVVGLFEEAKYGDLLQNVVMS